MLNYRDSRQRAGAIYPLACASKVLALSSLPPAVEAREDVQPGRPRPPRVLRHGRTGVGPGDDVAPRLEGGLEVRKREEAAGSVEGTAVAPRFTAADIAGDGGGKADDEAPGARLGDCVQPFLGICEAREVLHDFEGNNNVGAFVARLARFSGAKKLVLRALGKTRVRERATGGSE